MELQSNNHQSYSKEVLENTILESYEEAKLFDLLENFILSISEDFDFYMDEDCTVEELIESFNEFDFYDNEYYIALIEAQTPAQKKAAKKRASKSKAKAKGPAKPISPKKAKIEPKKTEPKREETPKKAEPKKEETPSKEKPKGPSDAETIEKLVDAKSKIKDQIKTLAGQAEGNTDPHKSREIEYKQKELKAKELELSSQISTAKGDDDKAKIAKELSAVKSKTATLLKSIDAKKELLKTLKTESVKEAEGDSEVDPKTAQKITQTELEIAKEELEVKKEIAKEYEIKASSEKGLSDAEKEAQTSVNAEIKTDEAKIKELEGSSEEGNSDEVDPEKLQAAKDKLAASEEALTKATEAKDKLPKDAKQEEIVAADQAIADATMARDTDKASLSKLEAPDSEATATETPAAEAPASETPDTETPDTEEGDEEEGDDKEKQIEKLEKQYDLAKESYDSQLDDINKATESAREATHGILESGFFGRINVFAWLFVSKQRNLARVDFLQQLAKMIPDPEKAKAVNDALDKAKATANEIESQMAEAEKKGETSAEEESPEKLAKAKKASTESEETEETPAAEAPTKKEDDAAPLIPGTAEYVAAEKKKKAEAERKEKLKSKLDAPKPDEKAEKIKAIDDILKPQSDKLEKIKAAVAKIEDPKRKEQASVNVKDLEKAIAELKKRKADLGESFSSFENEVWAIDVLLEKLSSQLEDYLIYG